MIGRPPRDQAQRFWEKVDVRGPDECWPWKSGNQTNADGYGVFKYRLDANRYKAMPAPRAAWFLTNGDPGDLLIRHVRCANRLCCNQAHLAPGTDADNAADRERDGNTARGDNAGPRKHPESLLRGSHSHSSRLTEEQVRQIRKLSSTKSQRELARRFGVTKAAIYYVQKRRSWAHV
jgi:hypothetical protein